VRVCLCGCVCVCVSVALCSRAIQTHKHTTLRCAMSKRCQTVTENESCCICCDELQDGRQLCVLPCSHQYHSVCIQQWLVTNSVCPICRSSNVQCGHGGSEPHDSETLEAVIAYLKRCLAEQQSQLSLLSNELTATQMQLSETLEQSQTWYLLGMLSMPPSVQPDV